MSIFAISDLHLSFGIDKPMDVFGGRWTNYMEKLKNEWENTVSERDTVIIPGDISWATYLQQALEDFIYIDSLPGIKIISKGNHDYWWTTFRKLEAFLDDNGFSTIRFMHNNNYKIEGIIICGTRGWKCPDDDGFSAEDQKIYNRELQRFELSLKSIDRSGGTEIIAAMHYPPFSAKGGQTEFTEMMNKYNVNTCIYGHLHGESCRNAVEGMVNGIDFRLVSSDYLSFKPIKLK